MSFESDFKSVFEEAPEYVPPMKRFPDGDYVRYWYSRPKGKVIGQLYTERGKAVRQPFPYQGPDPAPWDTRKGSPDES